jgi:hypothetical protein
MLVSHVLTKMFIFRENAASKKKNTVPHPNAKLTATQPSFLYEIPLTFRKPQRNGLSHTSTLVHDHKSLMCLSHLTSPLQPFVTSTTTQSLTPQSAPIQYCTVNVIPTKCHFSQLTSMVKESCLPCTWYICEREEKRQERLFIMQQIHQEELFSVVLL